MEPIENPLTRFTQWYNAECQRSQVTIPSAVCLSTLGLDGFPNARFVSFKELREEAFIITGPLRSRKALEIQQNAHVALTFWWPETGRQVRIQGRATEIPESLADHYFAARNTPSKAVSTLCEQGQPTDDPALLEKRVQALAAAQEALPRPEHWGGHAIHPQRMEFMEFRTSRFHDRTHYVLHEGNWEVTRLQP